MALIKCSKCGEEISDRGKICPHCKSWLEENISEKQENANSNKTEHNYIGIIGISVIVVIVFIIIMVIASNYDGKNSNDNKCDICGKSAYSSISGEEFCYNHYKDAINYYLDD